ncbi:MAG TPA: NAD-dependent epimerase/dehydratase family protein [Streptosporangiaceae bacterium]|jgi:nucleoside-diphosphate-sugar epimerase
MSAVVVTGSSGMLGGNLADYLVRCGYQVTGVDLRPPPGQPGWPFLVGDIRDLPAMTSVLAGADAVVHCAGALPSYPADQIRDVIVGGTRNVLEASRRAGAQRVVHISSTAVYGLPALVPTPEEYPRRPVDTYGRAKAAAEETAEEFRARGLCVPIVRPKTFLGAGRMGLFAMLFEWAEEGRNFPVLGRGDARIQMLAIEDLITVVEMVLRVPPDVASDTYNVAAAEFGTIRADFQAVLDAAGHGKRVVSVPARPALTVLKLLERMRLSPVYGRLLHKLLADSYVDTSKARQRLGFEPRLSNRDAIVGAYRWWQQSHAGLSASSSGRTSGDAWRQGALTLAKAFF